MNEKKDIKEIILDVLADGKVHLKKDIEEILISKKIIECKNADVLRNALYILKNKGKIESLGKGKYKIKTDKELSMFAICDEELDEFIEKLKKDSNYIRTINIVKCSEEVYKDIKSRAHKLNILQKEIEKIIN